MRREQGEREYRALIDASPPELLAAVRERSPQLCDASSKGGFGGSLARAELPASGHVVDLPGGRGFRLVRPGGRVAEDLHPELIAK
jgi:hypothetical protein